MASENKVKAEERYKAAALDLQRVTCSHLGEITFPKFEVNDGTEDKAKALGQAVENIIQARSEIKKQREAKRRIGDIVIGWFRASYPFANLLITVAKEASAVPNSE